MRRGLGALDGTIGQAAAYGGERGNAPTVLTSARLAPDMNPLKRQVQLVSDTAKGACARLAGLPVPSFEDTETTFPELKSRIAKTRAFMAGIRPEQIDGSEERDIVLKAGASEFRFKGQD